MVTLNEYLYGRWRKGDPSDPPQPATAWPDFAASVVTSVAGHVLEGDSHADLRQELEALKEALRCNPNPIDLSQSANGFDGFMREFRTRFDKACRSQGHDMYKMLAMLNEALLLLASGSERTVGRLKQLEVSLERTATIHDITTLKSKLAEIVQFVREESRRERQESQAAVSTLDDEIRVARETITWLKLDLPDRDEAMAAMQTLSATGGRNPFAAVFVLDRLPAIAERYGDEATGDLVQELVHKRIRPLATGSPPYRWSANAILLLIPHAPDITQINERIAREASDSFEYKIFVGARIATLRIHFRWVVMPALGSATLAEDIEAFVKGGVRR
ncbi:MAG TPA: hypothetical protein VKV15_19690 [Bryobacteraceae bacterium]|nr:hypothetical protein [Bryobacteraceae bacterium]